MAFISMSWVTLGALVFLVGALVYSTVREEKPTRWSVVVRPTRDFIEKDPYYDSYRSGGSKINIASTVQVRVQRGSNESALIATIPIGADDFKEKLLAAQSTAEDRASGLNAYVGSGS